MSAFDSIVYGALIGFILDEAVRIGRRRRKMRLIADGVLVPLLCPVCVPGEAPRIRLDGRGWTVVCGSCGLHTPWKRTANAAVYLWNEIWELAQWELAQ